MVLWICGCANIGVSVTIHWVDHVRADVEEVRNDSIVQEGVLAEDRRMVIDCCHKRGCSNPNMGEDGCTGYTCTDAAKADVIETGLCVLVEGRMLCSCTVTVEFCRGRLVTIDIQKAIASCDLVEDILLKYLCSELVRLMKIRSQQVLESNRSQVRCQRSAPRILHNAALYI